LHLADQAAVVKLQNPHKPPTLLLELPHLMAPSAPQFQQAVYRNILMVDTGAELYFDYRVNMYKQFVNNGNGKHG